MTTFSLTVDEFHKNAKSFFDKLPSSTPEEAENGYHALSLMYVGIQNPTDVELYRCSIVLTLAGKKLMEHQIMVGVV